MTVVNEKQLLQNAENALEVQMQKIEALQAEVASNANEIADLDNKNAELEQKYQDHEANSKKYWLNTDNPGGDYTVQQKRKANKDAREINQNNGKINAYNAGMQGELSQLEALDPGLVQMGKVLTQALAGHEDSVAYANENFSDFLNVLHSILAQMSAMEILDNDTKKQNVQIQYGDVDNVNSGSLMSQEEAVIAAQNNLQSSLNQAMSNTQLVDGQGAMTTATYQLTHESVGQSMLNSVGLGNEGKLQQEITAVQAFATLLTSIQKQLSSVNVVNVELGQILQSLNIVIAKVQVILKNPHMSVAEKKAKILALLMVALSLFAQANEVFANVKSQLQSSLANANTQAAKEMTQAVNISQQDKAAMQKTQNEIQDIMNCLNIAFSVLMFIQMPIAFAVIEALSQAGVFKDISTAIANDLEKDGVSKADAQITADVFTSVIQVVMMVGIDKIGERAIAKMASAFIENLAKNVTVEGSEGLSKQTIELTVKKYFAQGLLEKLPGLVEGLAKAMGSSLEGLSKKLEQMAEKIVVKVEEGVDEAEMNADGSVREASQNIPHDNIEPNSRVVLKTIAEKLNNLSEKLLTIRTGLSEVVEKAQKDALSRSLVGSEEVEKIAEECASKALGDTTKTVGANDGKLANVKQGVKKVLESKAFLYSVTSLLSVMQNNIIEDAITAAKSGKANSQEVQKIENVLNLIQEVIEMLLMVLAGAGTKNFDNTSTSLQLVMQKIGGVIGGLTGLTQSSLMIGQGSIQKDLAAVNGRLIKQKAALQLIEGLLSQINSKQSEEISSSMQEAFTFYNQMTKMSTGLSEGEKAQAQVLLSFV